VLLFCSIKSAIIKSRFYHASIEKLGPNMVVDLKIQLLNVANIEGPDRATTPGHNQARSCPFGETEEAVKVFCSISSTG